MGCASSKKQEIIKPNNIEYCHLMICNVYVKDESIEDKEGILDLLNPGDIMSIYIKITKYEKQDIYCLQLDNKREFGELIHVNQYNKILSKINEVNEIPDSCKNKNITLNNLNLLKENYLKLLEKREDLLKRNEES